MQISACQLLLMAQGFELFFPELTGERRIQLVKSSKDKLEDAKVAIRRERGEVSDDLNAKKRWQHE